MRQSLVANIFLPAPETKRITYLSNLWEQLCIFHLILSVSVNEERRTSLGGRQKRIRKTTHIYIAIWLQHTIFSCPRITWMKKFSTNCMRFGQTTSQRNFVSGGGGWDGVKRAGEIYFGRTESVLLCRLWLVMHYILPL